MWWFWFASGETEMSVRREDDSEQRTRSAAVRRFQEFVSRAALTEQVRFPACYLARRYG